MHKKGSLGFFIFLIIFSFFVVFLYGPILSIILLSFQGPSRWSNFSIKWIFALLVWRALGKVQGWLILEHLFEGPLC